MVLFLNDTHLQLQEVDGQIPGPVGQQHHLGVVGQAQPGGRLRVGQRRRPLQEVLLAVALGAMDRGRFRVLVRLHKRKVVVEAV